MKMMKKQASGVVQNALRTTGKKAPMVDHPTSAHAEFSKACGSDGHGMKPVHTTKPMKGMRRSMKDSDY